MDERQQYTQEQVQKLRVAEQMLAQGAAMGTVARKLGISEQIYLEWRTRTANPRTLRNDMPKRALSTTAASHPVTFPVQRDESWEMFGLFVNAMLADVAVTRVGPPADLPSISPKLIPALLYLAQHSGQAMTVGQLAEGIGVSLGWASRVTEELGSAGLVDRIRDDHDRRIVRLNLTPRATAVSSRLWSDREGAIVAALGTISPADRPVVTRFLRRLTAELELHASKASPSHA